MASTTSLFCLRCCESRWHRIGSSPFWYVSSYPPPILCLITLYRSFVVRAGLLYSNFKLPPKLPLRARRRHLTLFLRRHLSPPRQVFLRLPPKVSFPANASSPGFLDHGIIFFTGASCAWFEGTTALSLFLDGYLLNFSLILSCLVLL